MDPQLTQVLDKMTEWLRLLTIVSITGFALLTGGLIASNIALQRALHDLRRITGDIAAMTRDVASMTQQILRRMS